MVIRCSNFSHDTSMILYDHIDKESPLQYEEYRAQILLNCDDRSYDISKLSIFINNNLKDNFCSYFYNQIAIQTSVHYI